MANEASRHDQIAAERDELAEVVAAQHVEVDGLHARLTVAGRRIVHLEHNLAETAAELERVTGERDRAAAATDDALAGQIASLIQWYPDKGSRDIAEAVLAAVGPLLVQRGRDEERARRIEGCTHWASVGSVGGTATCYRCEAPQ